MSDKTVQDSAKTVTTNMRENIAVAIDAVCDTQFDTAPEFQVR